MEFTLFVIIVIVIIIIIIIKSGRQLTLNNSPFPEQNSEHNHPSVTFLSK